MLIERVEAARDLGQEHGGWNEHAVFRLDVGLDGVPEVAAFGGSEVEPDDEEAEENG